MDRTDQIAAIDDAFMLGQFGWKRGKPLRENALDGLCVKLLRGSLADGGPNGLVKTRRSRRFTPDRFALRAGLLGVAG